MTHVGILLFGRNTHDSGCASFYLGSTCDARPAPLRECGHTSRSCWQEMAKTNDAPPESGASRANGSGCLIARRASCRPYVQQIFPIWICCDDASCRSARSPHSCSPTSGRWICLVRTFPPPVARPYVPDDEQPWLFRP